MKALVAYYSESGNTEKVAKAIFEGIHLGHKEIKPINEIESVDGYDVIFVGFPVQSHSMPGKAEAFIKTIPEGQKIAFFATHGSLRGGELAITAFYHALSLAANRKVLGTFGCRGKVRPAIIEALMKKAESKGWAHEAQGASAHPHETDLEDAKEFAQWMVNKARYLG